MVYMPTKFIIFMNKILKIGLIVLGVLVTVFSAFIAYAYYYNPRVYTLCCAPDFGEEYTTEFADRDFLLRFTSNGGFGGSSLTIKINGDGAFERATIPFSDPENTKLEVRGRLSKQDMLLLVSRIESSNFFNLPKELENLNCFDASGTSLTISLDENYHVVSEYCSFDTLEGERYHSLVSLVSQMTTERGK